ncbi:MAG: 4-hydroxy-tetrahydrodipicolinate reductase [Methylococcales bacterium]|nr:4-hydroxy-tetrahydrodipicolinate reductase [Methylococcales bacterium]
MTRIAIVGASGKMGVCLIKAAVDKKLLTVAISGTAMGKDAGDLAGAGTQNIMVGDDLAAVVDEFDVLIDFTRPEPSMKYLEICRKAGKKIVIGTTGYSLEEKQQIKEVSKEIAVMFSPNMSIGVNISLKLLEMTAKIMGDYTDIEIIETHHRHKVDSPSGTALLMGQVIADTLGWDLDEHATYGRSKGNIGARESQTIGFSTIRGGDIVAEHTVMFADVGERVEITHKASNRMTFAIGAVRAAEWLANEDKGFYDMQDVLGLSSLHMTRLGLMETSPQVAHNLVHRNE